MADVSKQAVVLLIIVALAYLRPLGRTRPRQGALSSPRTETSA